MDKQNTKLVQWQILNQDGKWTWRRLYIDGGLDAVSAREFRDYAFAVNDAVVHGFRPRKDYWLIVTDIGSTHFRFGQPPVFIPRKDGEIFPPLLKPIPLDAKQVAPGKSSSSKSGAEQ